MFICQKWCCQRHILSVWGIVIQISKSTKELVHDTLETPRLRMSKTTSSCLKYIHTNISFYVGTGTWYIDTYTCCAWAGGTFFQLCCCVSFWFWWEIGFGLHTYLLRVPYSCGVVSVFCFWWEKVLVRTYLPYSCGVVLVFLVLAENSFWVTYVHSVQYSCAVVFLKNDYSVSLF